VALADYLVERAWPHLLRQRGVGILPGEQVAHDSDDFGTVAISTPAPVQRSTGKRLIRTAPRVTVTIAPPDMATEIFGHKR
jgi:hypothetical protein